MRNFWGTFLLSHRQHCHDRELGTYTLWESRGSKGVFPQCACVILLTLVYHAQSLP